VPDAEARRMGGSKSFGMQRTAPAKQNVAPTPPRLSWSRATPSCWGTGQRPRTRDRVGGVFNDNSKF